MLGDGHFFVSAEDFAKCVANLAERGINLHRLVNIGHQVFFAFRRGAQSQRGGASTSSRERSARSFFKRTAWRCATVSSICRVSSGFSSVM